MIISGVTADGTHRARGGLPRGPFVGLLGLTLGTPALLLILLVAYVLASVSASAWGLVFAVAGGAIGALSLRLAGARPSMVNRFVAIAGAILFAISAAVVVLDVVGLVA